ncbi:MAG: hypothetical protein VKS61_18040 [Candidatus Sericytochromatia bacterium]|nr:hypothetical protein [Candidatus Sericytochromatia bacterium]
MPTPLLHPLVQLVLLALVVLEGGLLWGFATTDAVGTTREQAECRALATEAAAIVQQATLGKGAPTEPLARAARLQTALLGLKLGEGGYAVTVDRQGRYASHPIREVVAEGQTLRSRAEETENEGLAIFAGLLPKQQAGLVPFTTTLGRQPAWLAFQAVPGSDLTVAVCVVKGELAPTAPRKRRLLILAALALGPLLAALALWRNRNWADERVLWRASIGAASGLALVVAVTWAHGPVHTDEDTAKQPGAEAAGARPKAHALKPLLDHEALAHHQHELTYRAQTAKLPPPRFVPTGLYVRTVEFNSEQDVRVGGTVWQRFRLGQDDDLRRGVRFPESISRSLASLVEVYRKRIGPDELVGWDFDQVIRSHKRFEAYPLNDVLVAIHLWPQDHTGHVVLVPDLGAYPLLAPWARPGVDDHLVATRPLEETYFGMKSLAFGTTFGDPGFPGEVHYPELTYVMNFENDMYVPIFGNLMPVVMIAVLLFATLLNQARSAANWGVFGMVSGLFFSLGVAQVKLRELFETETLVYLEQFYVVLYLALALVCVNAMLLARPEGRRPAWVAYRDNLLVQLAYWPLLTGALAVLTVAQFL